MQTHRLVYPAAALVCIAGLQALARLGENQTQFSTRYGTALEDRGKTNLTRTVELKGVKTYESQGWKLRATFVDGRAERIEYRKIGSNYSPQDIQAVLQAEAGGGRWFEKAGAWATWTNANGSVCSRNSPYFDLTVESAKCHQREAATKAERNKTQPAPKF